MSDLFQPIVNLTETIGGWFSSLYNSIQSIWQTIVNIWTSILSILSTLWYWVKTLISWVWNLILQVFQWELFYNVWKMFYYLSDLIWGPATIFMITLFIVIIVRIGVSFVFNLLKLNVWYKTLQKKVWK